MNEVYSGQFCFVQAENGRVVEISYEKDSHPEGVNLKKSIAAAFQANLNNQEEEEEEDPQSVHVAHYRWAYCTVLISDLHVYCTAVLL